MENFVFPESSLLVAATKHRLVSIFHATPSTRFKTELFKKNSRHRVVRHGRLLSLKARLRFIHIYHANYTVRRGDEIRITTHKGYTKGVGGGRLKEDLHYTPLISIVKKDDEYSREARERCGSVGSDYDGGVKMRGKTKHSEKKRNTKKGEEKEIKNERKET